MVFPKSEDRWGEVNLLKISAPLLFRFGSEGVLQIFPQRITELLNQLLTKVFVEEPWLHRVC